MSNILDGSQGVRGGMTGKNHKPTIGH
jgi:hypothetical protein